MDDIPYNDRIELAIADLETQECLNYTAIARKYKIERITLSRRHRNVTGSKENQYFYIIKIFTNVQENILI
jgi:DNA invertase Pin-like site-specific DNA recombinase